jgi:hypothetical protein
MMLLIILVLDGELKRVAFTLASRRTGPSGLSIVVCDAFSFKLRLWLVSFALVNVDCLSGVLFAVSAVLSQVRKV